MGRAALAAALLAGCLGPLLPLPPPEPRGAHEWLCINRACPAEAARAHGVVAGVRYNRRARLCECAVEDERHLVLWLQVPPHEPALVLSPLKR